MCTPIKVTYAWTMDTNNKPCVWLATKSTLSYLHTKWSEESNEHSPKEWLSNCKSWWRGIMHSTENVVKQFFFPIERFFCNSARNRLPRAWAQSRHPANFSVVRKLVLDRGVGPSQGCANCVHDDATVMRLWWNYDYGMRIIIMYSRTPSYPDALMMYQDGIYF